MTTATEIDDLLSSFRRQRGFLRQTLDGLTDAQVAERPTVSSLCLGGLVKHMTVGETNWIRFANGGPLTEGPPIDWAGIDWANPPAEVLKVLADRENEFTMLPQDTRESVLTAYAQTADATDRTLRELDLDASHELPRAPWFGSETHWTVRRVVLHLLNETAQHSGHADILRESIDGAKTMG